MNLSVITYSNNDAKLPFIWIIHLIYSRIHIKYIHKLKKHSLYRRFDLSHLIAQF
jgi:hypothetical protein